MKELAELRVLLVRPPRMKQAITLGEFMFSEPIGLECIYGILKDDYEVKIVDLMVEGESLLMECINWRPQVVGFTSLCVDVFMVRELAKQVKEYDKDIITMVGGTQAYLNPEAFFISEIDHVMKYTTNDNLRKLFYSLVSPEKVPLLDGIYSNVNQFRSTEVSGRNDYMVPDRSATSKYRSHYSYFGYKPCAIMQTSQGCSSHCSFCLRWRIEGGKEENQPLECIIGQIEDIDEPSIMIFDNDFLHDGPRLMEFCKILEERSIRKNFICYGSVKSIINHGDAIRKFAENGLKAVIVGYETFRDDELKNYQKKSSVDDNILASKILKELKVDCWASFMLHPDWTKEDFKGLKRYLRRLRPEITTLSPLTAFPNLPIYETYKDRLLFEKEDYTSWSFGKVCIMPTKMSLRRYYFELLRTNIYINFYLNGMIYMTKKFGLNTLLRIALGSIKVSRMYIGLMIQGEKKRS